jgi:hypothetical protein
MTRPTPFAFRQEGRFTDGADGKRVSRRLFPAAAALCRLDGPNATLDGVEAREVGRSAANDRRRQAIHPVGDPDQRVFHAFEVSRVRLENLHDATHRILDLTQAIVRLALGSFEAVETSALKFVGHEKTL